MPASLRRGRGVPLATSPGPHGAGAPGPYLGPGVLARRRARSGPPARRKWSPSAPPPLRYPPPDSRAHQTGEGSGSRQPGKAQAHANPGRLRLTPNPGRLRLSTREGSRSLQTRDRSGSLQTREGSGSLQTREGSGSHQTGEGSGSQPGKAQAHSKPGKAQAHSAPLHPGTKRSGGREKEPDGRLVAACSERLREDASAAGQGQREARKARSAEAVGRLLLAPGA